MPIEHISDTAKWVAVYRAMESERSDALFHDPYARRLAGEQGEEIVNTMRRGRSMAWAMVVRTVAFDELILSTVEQGNVTRVLNLAAGLDTRPWRLQLPPSLQWIDVDLPGILDYKVNAMADTPPRCSYEAVRVDLTNAAERKALFDRLASDEAVTLVVTEGLLIYLTDDDVSALARDLYATPGLRWWLIDLASPRLLEIMERYWGRETHAGNAPFQFAPAEGTEFFKKLGYREVEYRSSVEEAHRLHREMKMMWLWRFLGGFSTARREEMRRMSAFVLLERER